MSSLCVCNECNFYILWKRSSQKCYSPFVLSGLLVRLLHQCPYYFHSVPRAPTSSRSWNAIHPFNKEKSWVLPFSIRKYVFNFFVLRYSGLKSMNESWNAELSNYYNWRSLNRTLNTWTLWFFWFGVAESYDSCEKGTSSKTSNFAAVAGVGFKLIGPLVSL